MKTKIYLRLANSPYEWAVKASKTKKNNPLMSSTYDKNSHHATVCIALNIEVPDEMFEKAQAELDLKVKESTIASNIKVEEAKK